MHLWKVENLEQAPGLVQYQDFQLIELGCMGFNKTFYRLPSTSITTLLILILLYQIGELWDKMGIKTLLGVYLLMKACPQEMMEIWTLNEYWSIYTRFRTIDNI